SNIEGLIYTLNDILQDYNNEEADEIIGLINQSIQRFKNTLLDLTEISKVQNINEEAEDVNILDVIQEVKITLASQIESYKADICVDLEIVNVKFSRKNLRSIIYNLLSNGIKYSSPKRKPQVKISTEQWGIYLLLRIEDNGLGIRTESIPQIFSMFKRLHDHVDGTGLGLYILKKIIENAGGKIEVESELDKGTVFNLFLKNT
ncbi:MAG: sensor histidine kinase, partial [Cytophagaceae bacterium]